MTGKIFINWQVPGQIFYCESAKVFTLDFFAKLLTITASIKCSEVTLSSKDMKQIYRRTPMPKSYFQNVYFQLYWNRTYGWVFSCKFVAYFQNNFLSKQLRRAACECYSILLNRLNVATPIIVTVCMLARTQVLQIFTNFFITVLSFHLIKLLGLT